MDLHIFHHMGTSNLDKLYTFRLLVYILEICIFKVLWVWWVLHLGPLDVHQPVLRTIKPSVFSRFLSPLKAKLSYLSITLN